MKQGFNCEILIKTYKFTFIAAENFVTLQSEIQINPTALIMAPLGHMTSTISSLANTNCHKQLAAMNVYSTKHPHT